MMANFMGNYYGDGMVSNWGLFGMGGWGLIMTPFVLILIAWTFYWKYRALWYAAKHDHKWWFITLLIINTAGILEILYLYVFSKKVDQLKHDESKTPMVQ